MLLALKERVINLEESMRDIRETLKVVVGRIAKLDLMEEQIRNCVGVSRFQCGRDARKMEQYFHAEDIKDDNAKDDELRKAPMRFGLIRRGVESKRGKKSKKKLLECLCSGSHKMQHCLEQSKLFTISKEVEAEPKEKRLSKLELMILNPAKAKRGHKPEGLIFVDINIQAEI
ncbi:hypothetical protein J1N35_026385 [Gossypium stocksii]|uniref:Uncharacterized protein n=1 Tax=Gossypium stocksii TaxID=47602 RepID=A0A9D3ZY46_9ROSI|nr:hypothetical protein J1N35_026385 [Gossypium stocksii]